jgi:hypothetical protein
MNINILPQGQGNHGNQGNQGHNQEHPEVEVVHLVPRMGPGGMSLRLQLEIMAGVDNEATRHYYYIQNIKARWRLLVEENARRHGVTIILDDSDDDSDSN